MAISIIVSRIRYLINVNICKLNIKYIWKKSNRNNKTSIAGTFNTFLLDHIRTERIIVGKHTYGRLNIDCSGDKNEGLEIGAYCSISNKARFLLGGEHNYSCVSTYPFDSMLFGTSSIGMTKGKIIIKDDVWIGDNTLILSGVTIGQGAVIAAGSVVTSDVPPYAIVGGVKSRVIKYRFSEHIIQQLLQLDYNRIDFNKVSKSKLEEKITEDNIYQIVEALQHSYIV